MIARLSVLLLVVSLAGCTWEDRPDGSDAVHSASDGYYETDAAPQSTPLGGGADEVEVVEPLDQNALSGYREAPLDQAVPTTGAVDDVSEADEALTPGGDQ